MIFFQQDYEDSDNSQDWQGSQDIKPEKVELYEHSSF